MAGPFPKKNAVRISLTDDGKLTADPERVPIQAGGQLTFQIDPSDKSLVSFVVLMKAATPFGSGHSWAGSRKNEEARLRIDGKAHDPHADGSAETSYSYAIMASDGKKAYYRDPDVIVGPPA